MSAKVNKEKCMGCGQCVDVCPVQAIEIKEKKAVVSDSCVDCGVCLNACPVDALSMS